MKLLKVFQVLGPVDARSLWRDSLLRWMLVVPVLPALVVRWGIPELAAWLQADYSFDLTEYYPLIMGFFTLFVPMMVGMVIGFLLLDERDDRTLTALRVTPLRVTDYLAYRISLPTLLSIILTVVCFYIAGLVKFPLWALVPIAVMSGLEGPMEALLLASFASNKVVGMAMLKGFGTLFIAPLAMFFIESNWQFLAGILPTFWPVKTFWQLYSGATGWGWMLVLGFISHGLVLAWLVRRFNRITMD